MKEKLVAFTNQLTQRLPKKKIKEAETEIVKTDTLPGRLKKTVLSLTPYGKVIEKIYLFVILATFTVLLFESGSIVTEDKVLILAVAVGGLFILRSLRRKLYFPKKYTIIYTLFLLFSVLTTIFSVNIYNSLLYLTELFAAGLIGILGYDIVYGKYSRRWILNAFTVVFTGILVYGIFRYVIDKTSLTYPLGFPAYMGTVIVMLLPFVLSSTIKTKGNKRILFFIATFALLLGAYLTFATPIYIIAGLEIVFFVVVNLLLGRRSLMKRKYFAPLLTIGVIVLFFSVLLHFTSSGIIPFGDNSFADRNLPVSYHLAALQQGFDAFKANPILGTGLGNFRIVSLYHQASAWHLMYYMNNDIAETFVAEGIVGGLLFVGVFAYILYEIFRKVNFIKIFKKQTPETMELAVALIAAIILSFYYPIFHVPVILYTFFLFVGILLKDLNVDNAKRYYFGNLSIGVINGISVFFIIISAYFFITNYQFTQVRNNITQNNIADAQKSIERLVQINPINTSFSSILSQIYLSQGLTDKAISMNNLAAKYNSKSPYVQYTNALNYYFKGDITKAKQIDDQLIKDAPYADPVFYLLGIHIDQSSTDTSLVQKDLQRVVDKYPINKDFTLFQPIYTNLGFSDILSQIYLELGLMTKNQNYINIAQKINSQGLSVVGK